MGVFSDWFGGDKAPAPPPELAQAAQAAKQIAAGSQARLPLAAEMSNFLIPRLPELANFAAENFGEAGDRANELGDVYEDLFDNGGREVLKRATDDALLAGSEGRQQEEAAFARAAQKKAFSAALKMYHDENARRGITQGGGNAPHLAVLQGSQIAAAENAARLNERRYGEAIRLNFIPTAAGFGETSALMRERAGQLDLASAEALGIVPNMTHSLMANEFALADSALGHQDTMSDLFSTQYNAALAKHQSDQARKGNLFKNLGTVAAIAAAPFTGGASLAAIPAVQGGGLGGGSGSLGGAATNNPIPGAGAPGNPVFYPT